MKEEKCKCCKQIFEREMGQPQICKECLKEIRAFIKKTKIIGEKK